MKPSHIHHALETAYTVRRPVMLTGAPGVGKSQVIAQFAKAHDLRLIDVRTILLDPVDLRGLPHLHEGRAAWAIPDFLPRIDRDGERGLLFLDELLTAPPAVQAACYQLVLDRRLGEYELPPGWSILAAGNRQEDRAGAHRMLTALANRFIHLTFDIDVDEWVSWALSAGMPTELIAFIRFRPELLHKFEPTAKEAAFPSPRTWQYTGETLLSRPRSSVEHALYVGTVGEGAAAEFTGFLRVFRSIPDPDVVLMSPASAPVPNDPATLYALAGALARKATRDNFERVVEYIERLPAEYAVVTVRDATTLHPACCETRTFIQWLAKNNDVLV